MTNLPFLIRPASPQDLALLVSFNIAMAAETEGKMLDKETVTAGVSGLLNQPQHGFYRVAERNGQVVGALMVTSEWSDWRNGLFWWIQSVYVSPQARRQGVFRALYRAISEEARARGDIVGLRLYVEQDNHAAQRTYRELGMSRSHYLVFETGAP